MQNNYWYN